MYYTATGCIVTHNNQNVIYDTISSILKFTDNIDFKLYVVDNASTDNTIQILENFKDDIILIKNDVNYGFSVSHNKVIDIINSDYHFVINPDIFIDSYVVDEMCTFFYNNEDIVLAMPKILNFDSTVQYLPKKVPKIKYLLSGFFPFLSKIRDEYTMKNFDFSDITDIDFCSGCFMVCKTKTLKSVEGFDTRYFMYFEDIDLTLTLKQLGRVVINPHSYVYHLWNRDSHKNLKYLFIQILSMLKFFNKWKRLSK